MIRSIFENTLNKAFSLDANAAHCLKKLNGKSLCVQFDNSNVQPILIIFNETGVELSENFNQTPDMRVRGPFQAFLKLALTKDTRLAARLGLSFEGDPVTLNSLQPLFITLKIDWEELLSKFTGDIIAHQIGNVLRYARKRQKEVLRSATLSISEYLQEESQCLPTKIEVDNFINAIDKLRSDVDRLEAKIAFVSSSHIAKELK